MSLWKKVAGGVMSAALLSSLLATSVFASTSPSSTGADQTDWLNCAVAAVASGNPATGDTCSQVADGISTVGLVGEGGALAGQSLYITANGATIIAATNDFTLAGGIVTAADGATIDATDTITLRSPSSAGTATVSVYTINSTTGISSLEGTLTITFTATSGLNVSTANSTVNIDTDLTCATQTHPVSSAVAALPAAPAAGLCITLEDGNGNPVAGTPTVQVTITPVGLVHFGAAYPGGTNGQVVSQNAAAGVANFQIINTGLSGVATIGISVTQGTTTTTFPPKTFTFTGAVASITATGAHVVAPVSGSSLAGAVTFVAKDASGNKVPTSGETVVTTGSIFNGAPTVTAHATATDAGTITYACGATAGSGTIAVKANSITSNAVTVFCSGAADTMTVAFDKATVAPGGQATITVTVKDSAGNPAPDTNTHPYSVVVSSGAVLATTGGDLANGVATWTFLAPFNTGVVTVLASGPASLTTTSPQSASINVTTPQPLTVFAPTTSALGNTTTGTFTFSTKIQAKGGYITWKVDGGSGLAGKTIQIWVYKKYTATGAWVGPTMLTTRVANASGVAYVNILSRGVLWLSLRPVLPATTTDAAVWGPTSIGRWR